MCVLCIFLQGLLVYVNYGTINDFLYLTENLSLSLNGRICIARYGHIYRGDKVCRFLFSWDHSLMQEACQVVSLVLIVGITHPKGSIFGQLSLKFVVSDCKCVL